MSSPAVALAALVAVLATGCGGTAPDDQPYRPASAEERVLADRYRAVVGMLDRSDARAICAMARGEILRDFKCASDAPAVPRGLRALRPHDADLHVYPDLDGLILGAPLRGRDDRLFIGFAKEGRAASWPVYTIGVGHSG